MAGIGHEHRVRPPGHGPHVGDVSDPQPVRAWHGEFTRHHISAMIRLVRRHYREGLTSFSNTLQAGLTHHPGGVTGPVCQLSRCKGVPHLAVPVHAIVMRVNPLDLITHRPGTARAGFRGAVATRGKEPTLCLASHPADGLDPELSPVDVDEPDHIVVGRSSSAAKKAEAFFKISCAQHRSALSRRRRLLSASGFS